MIGVGSVLKNMITLDVPLPMAMGSVHHQRHVGHSNMSPFHHDHLVDIHLADLHLMACTHHPLVHHLVVHHHVAHHLMDLHLVDLADLADHHHQALMAAMATLNWNVFNSRPNLTRRNAT